MRDIKFYANPKYDKFVATISYKHRALIFLKFLGWVAFENESFLTLSVLILTSHSIIFQFTSKEKSAWESTDQNVSFEVTPVH